MPLTLCLKKGSFTDEFLMLDETHHFILIIIYTASSECEIFRNLQATKMARVGKI